MLLLAAHLLLSAVWGTAAAAAAAAAGGTARQLAAAEPALRAAVAELRAAQGSRAADTLSHISSLGTLLYARGALDESEALLREALAGQRACCAGHPDTLDTIFNLAVVEEARGRLPEARALYEEELAGLLRIHGAGHAAVAVSEENLRRMRLGEL